MNATIALKTRQALTLQAETAGDLMAPNPISLRADANVHEALALLTDKGFSAAPVIDDAGRYIGIVTVRRLLAHLAETP